MITRVWMLPQYLFQALASRPQLEVAILLAVGVIIGTVEFARRRR